MKQKKYIFLLIVLVSQFVLGQVKFEARVSKKQLGINERLRIEFSMNKEGDNFRAPSFNGFDIVGGPSQSVSHSWVNGKRSFSKVYSYVLSPSKKGDITIGSAAIEINGQVYKSKPIKIRVTNSITKPTNPNDPNYVAAQGIHLVTELSKTNPYLNEAIVLTQKLYVHPSISISDFNTLNEPKLTGFWSQDISDRQLTIERGEYQGNPYNYVVLKRTVLYPQTIGKIKIKSLKLDVLVNVPTNRRDFFGRRLSQTVHQKVSTQQRIINVKALPEAGKPEGYTGAVGQFDFDVTVDKNTLKSGESFKAVVRVKGVGNLKLFELPKLVVPSSLEVYEPEHSEKVKTSYLGMQGQIKDTYTIVPQYKGNYPIKPVSFSYFNPKTEQYVTLNSVQHNIDVLTGSVNTNASNSESSPQQKTIAKTHKFRSFKTETTLLPISKKHFFRTKLFWMLLLLPLLFIPLFWLIRKFKTNRKKDVIGNKQRKADKLAKKYLSEAKKNLNNKEAFYESLHKSLHNYLKAKLHLETSEFSQDKLQTIFAKNKVDSATSQQFLKLLDNCNLARFTPISATEMQKDYNAAVQVIHAIDKIL